MIHMQRDPSILRRRGALFGRGSYLMACCAASWVVLGMILMLLISGMGDLVPGLGWIAYALGTILLLGRMAGQSGCSTAVGVVGLAIFAVAVVGADLREDLLLHTRGREVTAIVVSEQPETISRGGKIWNVSLEHVDGTSVPGPPLVDDDHSLRVGDHVTVFEDPKGIVDPRTPTRADPTGEGLAFLAIAGVSAFLSFFTWRRGRRNRARIRKSDTEGGEMVEEERFKEFLRAAVKDRRGYIRMAPNKFPDLTQQRAAVLAREVGLKAEAFGNRGYWRFATEVVEEVDVAE